MGMAMPVSTPPPVGRSQDAPVCQRLVRVDNEGRHSWEVQLGFSWQKPARRPWELDPEKVERWLQETWEPAKKGRTTARRLCQNSGHEPDGAVTRQKASEFRHRLSRKKDTSGEA